MIKSIDSSTSVTNRSLSMSLYFSDLNACSIKKEKLNELYVKYFETKSEKYKNDIVCANANFVVSLAKQYQHMGLDLDDLIMEGNIGLIKAVELFDPTKGYTFLSFAVHYIRKYINIALNEKSRVVRLPFNRIFDGDIFISLLFYCFICKLIYLRFKRVLLYLPYKLSEEERKCFKSQI